jgi:SAM-dependent methyltransferase
MSARNRHDPRGSYDAVAEEFARRIYRELEHKPFDREQLERFAAQVRGAGTVTDLGCGPGHVARFLHERGVQVCGLDLSPRMVERAGQLNPGIEFVQGDMTALDVPDGAWAGIVAFYSVIHVARERVVTALREMRRTLRPGGPLLLSFHIGDEILHLDEWWGQEVSLDFVFFQPREMVGYLRDAGMEVEEVLEREPYAPEVEHQSRRCYILARAPRPEAEPARE